MLSVRGWPHSLSAHFRFHCQSKADAVLLPAAPMRPGYAGILALPEKRARGRPGARCTRGLAGCCRREMLPTSIQVQRRTPGLPCAVALRLIRDRPGDPAFCDTIALGQRWSPSNLTPASGRRTQTISPYAKAALVRRSISVHRISPRVRDDRERPSHRGRRAEYAFDLGRARSGIFSIRSNSRLDTISENPK